MASVRELKKDINYVLGDFIETVYQWERETKNTNSEKSNQLIDKAIKVFDDLMKKANQKKVENAKAHFTGIRKELQQKTIALVEELGK